jgi:hypothetical protein
MVAGVNPPSPDPGGAHAAAPGPLLQEAALLAAALRDWVGMHGLVDPPGDATSTAGGGAPPAGQQGGTEGGATGDPGGGDQGGHASGGDAGPGGTWAATVPTTCAICPLCRLIASLTGGRPEVAAHLMDAVTSLTAAVRAAWESGAWMPGGSPAASGAGAGRPESPDDPYATRRRRAQRIDIT